MSDEAATTPAPDAPPKPSRMVGRESTVTTALAFLVPILLVGARAGGGFSREDVQYLVLGVGMATVMAIGARLQNRIVAMLGAAALWFGPWGQSQYVFLGLPYLGVAFYLAYRLSRAQGEQARQVRADRAAGRRAGRTARDDATGGGATRRPPAAPPRRGKKGGRVTAPGTRPRNWRP